jgi:polyisoprenoid-binding protein YceI
VTQCGVQLKAWTRKLEILSCSQTMSKPDTDSMRAEGSLTVRDRTRPLAFPVQISVLGEGEVILDERPR